MRQDGQKRGIKVIDNRETICILIPTYGNIPSGFLSPFLSLMVYSQQSYKIHIVTQEGQPVDNNRNMLVEKALEQKPDYIFFLDSDMACPQETIDRLIYILKEKNADMVTGLYFHKSKPYYPVIRQYKHGLFWNIENPSLGNIIEIGGAGMGCCVIRPSVFGKISKPWFRFIYEEGTNDIKLGEDVSFCKKMLENGMKMYCDTGLCAAHIGASIDIMDSLMFSKIRQDNAMERDEAIQDLMKFTGKDEKEVTLNIISGAELLAEEWRQKNPQTPEEIKKFYKETENYLYDLTNWHFKKRRQFDIELLERMEEIKIFGNKPRDILDFGCGIGQNAIMLARKGYSVTIADLQSKTLDFAEFRFEEHKLPYDIWRTDTEEMPAEKLGIEQKYDVILLFDVLEHLPKEELRNIANKLKKMKHNETEIIITAPFGKTAEHPMHFDLDGQRQQIIENLI
ncbi:methyltransferase domain-containing protein, partial [Candidatus Roizmanbacteria bacterium]|nr:methyltransferase domain-containing protein [Candidatus Roizmanbacteria bacterium]